MIPTNTMMLEHDDESIAVEELQRRVDALQDCACADCHQRLCGHEAMFSIALGFQNAPRCLRCLAAGMGRSAEQLRDHLWAHFQRRDCYRTVWHAENRREANMAGNFPRCLWPNSATSDPGSWDADDELESGSADKERPAQVDDQWDAGEMSCGDLVLALRRRMEALPPRAVLKLIAHDPAAPEDIPSWCRMTGHGLVFERHPEYFICRKEP